MVDHLVSCGGELLNQVVAQLQTGVVGGDVYAQGRFSYDCVPGGAAGDMLTPGRWCWQVRGVPSLTVANTAVFL